ncbi:hypothetical protein ACFYRL_34495 [Streptomyces goshikiensis]|uniref:hypothetical protein n=1 Tax=Streptomyces goshikiensis TaxID=1942 RepID=UPI003682DF2A
MSLLADGWTLPQRRLFRLRHEPGTLLAMLMMASVFVALFGFVFGGATGVPVTSNHRESVVSNALVPTDRMPVGLRALCEWNPFSSAAAAAREIFGNPGAPRPDAGWPLTHPVTASLPWAGLPLIFAPLSVRRFARAGL